MQNYFDQYVQGYSKPLLNDYEVIVNDQTYWVSLFVKCEYDSSDHRLRNIETTVSNISDFEGETYKTPAEIEDYAGVIQDLIENLESDEEELMSLLGII